MSESHDIEQIARVLCRDELEICRNMGRSLGVSQRPEEDVEAMVNEGWTYYEDRAKPLLPLLASAREAERERCVNIVKDFERGAYDGVIGDRSIREEKQAVMRDLVRAITVWSLPPIKEG